MWNFRVQQGRGRRVFVGYHPQILSRVTQALGVTSPSKLGLPQVLLSERKAAPGSKGYKWGRGNLSLVQSPCGWPRVTDLLGL